MPFTESHPRTTAAGRYVKDLVERVLSTFVIAFIGALITGGVFDVQGMTDVAAYSAAALAGVQAVLSLLKGLAAKLISDHNSASLAPGV